MPPARARMILADAHLHLFRRGFPGVYGKSLLGTEINVYETLRGAHGITAGLVVGYEGEDIDPGNNAYIRWLAADRPWIATVANVDTLSVPSAAAVASLIDCGHAGLSLYISSNSAAQAVVAWPVSVWDVLNQGRALISLNITPEYLSVLAPVMARHSGCWFLVSHMGLPGQYKLAPPLEDAAARLAPLIQLAGLSNVVVKISGLYAISDPPFAYPHHAAQPFINLLLDRFGPARCLWGSDFSPALDHVSFAQTVSNPWLDHLDDGERALVMGENLLRLLRRKFT